MCRCQLKDDNWVLCVHFVKISHKRLYSWQICKRAELIVLCGDGGVRKIIAAGAARNVAFICVTLCPD